MKDLPVFANEYGVASLVLREIPYRQVAYIHLQDVQQGKLAEMLDSCAGFCRAVGAQSVFATGHKDLQQYPIYAKVWKMSGQVYVPGEQSACLWPVTEENVSQWREIYNHRMDGVDNAQTLTWADERKILGSCGAYFVHMDGELLGIGWVEGNTLLAVASVKHGAGEAVTRALVSLVPDETVELEVASTNVRAIKLYERLGFVKTGELSVWYKIF